MPLPSKLPSNTASITPIPLLPSLERFLFSAISSAASHPHIKQIHSLILRLHLHRSNLLATKLLRRLSDLKVPFSPYHSLIFSHVPLPNSFLWTSLIRCSPNPFTIYSSMRRHCPPLSFTLSYLLKSSHSLQTGTQIHAQSIFIGGFDTDLFVQNTLIDFYVRCCRLDSASRVFDEMPVRDVISWTALIVAYSRSGDMASAEALFRGFDEKDEVAWTAMVTGYAQNARPGEALETFTRMQSAGFTIDEVSLTGAVSAAAQLGVARHAEFIRDAVDRAGIAWRNNAFVGSAMIDMYAKCGLIAEASEVFNCMAERNVYSYSAMIAGLAAHGGANEAISLFEEMVGGTPIRPNSVTFIGLLTACSHAGKVDEGRYYFDLMKDEYGITPSPDHYTCMVDLLGRTGLVEKALELVQSMPVEPHGGVWGSLLAACQIYNNSKIAEIAANRLFELEPDGIGNYVLLSNVYASAGMWDKVSEVRRLMRRRGLRKTPSSSWMDGKNGGLHEFHAGDSAHPRSKEINEKLEEEVMGRLNLEGHVPVLSSVVYGMSDDENECISEEP